MKNEVQGLTLAEFWEVCYHAYTWTSFSPEKRAVQIIKEYSEVLDSDLLELGENQGNYKEKFIQKFKEWMRSKGNCASTMITGGANFNVRRNEKANNIERSKSENFHKWRERYFQAVNRVKTPSPEEELDNALLELDEITNKQLMMKEMNAFMRKEVKTNAFVEVLEMFKKEGYPSELITEMGNNFQNGYGINFPSFTLTNNNAKIKRLTEKVNVMRIRIERKDTFETIVFDGGCVKLEDDRFKVFHEEKPTADVIKELKSNGFRWSPNWKCWCRKHTGNALAAIKRLSFIK